MAITTLRIADFRNLAAVELAPCPQGINLICGNNGSGKTSLLEAIHYLGSGRSFRSSTATRLVRYDADRFSIFSQLVSDNGSLLPLGVEREASGVSRMRMAEQEVSSVAELASQLPIRLINSQSHHLFESGPVYRRKFMDWGLFYHSEQFLSCWRHFERVLKQRNAVLRDRRPKAELSVWTEEFVKYGVLLDSLRREYLQHWAPVMIAIAGELLSLGDLSINYEQGWPESEALAEVLSDHYIDEMRLGYTQYGPQRADLTLCLEGLPVRHFLSRGQQKLLICAMILAQGVVLTNQANKRLIYLVDDLPSELDLQGRQKLISLLARQQTQVFITAIESDEISGFISDKFELPMKVFHVEHGKVADVAGLSQFTAKMAENDR